MFMGQNVVYLGKFLERVYVLLLLVEMFHKCQLASLDWWCCSVQLCPTDLLPAVSFSYW